MKKVLVQTSLLLLGMLIVGCEEKPKEEPKFTIPSVGSQVVIPVEKEVTTVKVLPPKQRFSLQKVQTFQDPDAYGKVRNIYILIDNSTGKEFVGVSGIGITESGTHVESKNNYEDER